MQDKYSEFNVAICLPQSITRLLFAAPTKPHKYSFAAPHEFLVGRLEIYHQSIVDATEQYHDQ